MEMVFNKGKHMTKRETLIAFIKDMLRPRTMMEIIDIEMRDAQLAKMQGEKSLEYANSVVEYNRQRIRRLEERAKELGGKDAWNNCLGSNADVFGGRGRSDRGRSNIYVE